MDALDELRRWSTNYEYFYDAYFEPEASFADQRPTATTLAKALQDGARLVPSATAEILREIDKLRATLADERLNSERCAQGFAAELGFLRQELQDLREHARERSE